MKKTIFISLVMLATVSCSTSDWLGDGNVVYEPQELILSKSSLSELIIGESRKLYASFKPAETTEDGIVWETDKESVAVVDENGVVTATGLGEAVITARSASFPDISASCNVSVTVESGIRVYDLLLDEPVEEELTFVLNATGSRDYYYEVFVHDTFDKSVEISTSDSDVVQVEEKDFDGRTGFTLTPGTVDGEATVTIQSTQNDDVKAELPVNLKTVHVKGLSLSLNEDGSEAESELTASLTVGRTQPVRVVFNTDDPETGIPSITSVKVTSSDPAVATVDAQGTKDPATQSVFFNVYMVDNTGNTGQTATVTVTADDGNYMATLEVTAQCPSVEEIIVEPNLSEPVHAGETVQLSFRTVPEDAYVQTVTWSSADDNVATVDENGLVTIKPDFVFDPANSSATEILITATTDDVTGVSGSCQLRPYQYVPATGVMVTDQWGNRMRGCTVSQNKISKRAGGSNASIQYCSGGGKNKTALFNDAQTWAVASPAVEGVEKVGSIAVYLTATPYPYTYPTIADPEQPFYWASYSNSRFSIAGAGYEDGSQSTGWSGYNKDDGKSKLFLGHTCKFWTGHSSSGDDALIVRVWRYVEGQANDAVQSKSDNLLFRFEVHTTDSKANANYGNPSIKNADGTAKVFNFLNTGGIPESFADPCPVPWTGPMPQPVGYYTLDDTGAPAQFQSWGDIPVPAALNEVN